jgi:hypothetical protein
MKKLPYDPSSHAGLDFIGKYLRRVNVNSLIDPALPEHIARVRCCIHTFQFSFFGLIKLCKVIWLQRSNNPQRAKQAHAADRATVVINPAGVPTESQAYDLQRGF